MLVAHEVEKCIETDRA